MESKEITHWTPEEELHYNFFLIYKADELLTFKNKSVGFYVEMASFIPSRTKIQCRSHHEKMIARFKNKRNADKKELQLMNLKAFYKDHYALRLLDSKHLLKEIEHHLAKKVEKNMISKEFYCLFREKAEINLNNLHFQNTQTQLQNEVVTKEQNIKQKLTISNIDQDLLNYKINYLLDPTEEPEFIHFAFFSDDNNEQF